MKRFFTITCVLVCTVLFTSCGSVNTLYSWYDYDNAIHTYMQKRTPKSEQALEKTYLKLIEHQKGTRKIVPPGIYAEYGYFLLKKGKTDEGIAMLEKEIELYPESKLFINKIIKQFKK